MITNTIRDASHSRLATLNYLKLCLTSDRSISAEYEDRISLFLDKIKIYYQGSGGSRISKSVVRMPGGEGLR